MPPTREVRSTTRTRSWADRSLRSGLETPDAYCSRFARGEVEPPDRASPIFPEGLLLSKQAQTLPLSQTLDPLRRSYSAWSFRHSRYRPCWIASSALASVAFS